MRSEQLTKLIGQTIRKFAPEGAGAVWRCDSTQSYRSERVSELCWRDTVGRSSAGFHFFADFAVDRTDRASTESEPPPLLRMKCNSALTRGIFKRSIGTIALIQRSWTVKSGVLDTGTELVNPNRCGHRRHSRPADAGAGLPKGRLPGPRHHHRGHG